MFAREELLRLADEEGLYIYGLLDEESIEDIVTLMELGKQEVCIYEIENNYIQITPENKVKNKSIPLCVNIPLRTCGDEEFNHLENLLHDVLNLKRKYEFIEVD